MKERKKQQLIEADLRIVALGAAVCEENFGHRRGSVHVDQLAGQVKGRLGRPVPKGLIVRQLLELLGGCLDQPWLIAPWNKKRHLVL
jgi:hypothetical protein